jgi:hypothetical protein
MGGFRGDGRSHGPLNSKKERNKEKNKNLTYSSLSIKAFNSVYVSMSQLKIN